MNMQWKSRSVLWAGCLAAALLLLDSAEAQKLPRSVNDKLPPLHPTFKEWTRERAVDPDVTMPYHPVAIQFYKGRGVWSAKMDGAQRRLAALNP